MNSKRKQLAFSYLRLSREEAKRGESTSISNQRMLIQKYCQQNGIIIVKEFSDDGYTGSNFQRPGFQCMLKELEHGLANTVITKDLSRLGRDMRESSYYAEVFFPENQIHYFTIGDSFDSERDNVLAPFQFAMNEVYLRDSSHKIKDVLKTKREIGEYCCCPPYGYKKSEHEKNKLVPDENTAPIVKRIFEAAAKGDSSRKIALSLSSDGVLPPLKYRVLYGGEFTEKGAERASDVWSYTTVKRILKNHVYLGHTLLGKSKKASIKSKKKIPIPKEDWVVTENTHEPLISQEVFEKANENLGKGSRDYRAYENIRKSIFSGMVFCSCCGYALCSCGTVYKGEREKYWYLSCTGNRTGTQNHCGVTRIKYSDLVTLVKDDLNSLITLSEEQIKQIVENVIKNESSDNAMAEKKLRERKLRTRLAKIDKIIPKLYEDYADGKLSEVRLSQMVNDMQSEYESIQNELLEFGQEVVHEKESDRYKIFFEMCKKYTRIDVLDRDILLTFIDRIEVGPKKYPEGKTRATHRNSPFEQNIRIFYKFVGEIEKEGETEYKQQCYSEC